MADGATVAHEELTATRVSPLAQVDKALVGAPAGVPGSDAVDRALSAIGGAVLRARDVPSDGSSWDRLLFNPRYGGETRRLMAVTLVRLLADHPAYAEDGAFRRHIVSLFDDTLDHDVYPALSLTKKTQSYEKLALLQEAPKRATETLVDTISSLSDISNVPPFRQPYLKALRSGLTKAIVQPFLPRTLVGKRLDNLLGSVVHTIQSDPAHQVEFFRRTTEDVEKFRDDARTFGTTYSLAFIATVAERLEALLRDWFATSPLSRPATVEVTPSDKRYPLDETGRSIFVRLRVVNHGPGHALDTTVHIHDSEGIDLEQDVAYLGLMATGPITLRLPATVASPGNAASLLGTASWSNADGSDETSEFMIDLPKQTTAVDWDALHSLDPYSLDPVDQVDDLVGRDRIMAKLSNRMTPRNLSNGVISGQKRVGKTSIAKTLKTVLETRADPPCDVLYILSGDFRADTAHATVINLGRRLCALVTRLRPSFATLQVPDFDGGLAPLIDFFERARHLDPTLRLLMLLDEFDELPVDLYRRTPTGDAFFLTLRSLSDNPDFGVILVGGEKMDFVLDWQGDRLNKFDRILVSYLDRASHWAEFGSMVRGPVDGLFDITDSALVQLYDVTAGNPYFTRLVCRELFELMLDRHDVHVTDEEVREATGLALEAAGAQAFSHFWLDGILDVGDDAEVVSMRRRWLLLAFAAAERHGDTSEQSIVANAGPYGLDPATATTELRSLVRRDVLDMDASGRYTARVPLFGAWIVEYGVREVISSFSVMSAELRQRAVDEESRVSHAEIVAFIETWRTYQGRNIEPAAVRDWLAQFGDPLSQRLMFAMLQGVRFVSADARREAWHAIHPSIIRGTEYVFRGTTRNRGDILVTYLDGGGKSGSICAYDYRLANRIYADNVVAGAGLRRALDRGTEIKLLVVVDDLIGSGGTAIDGLEQLAAQCGDVLVERGISVKFASIAALSEGMARVERAVSKLDFDVQVLANTVLTDADRAFSSRSRVFPDADQRDRARNLANRYGRLLEPKHPLGFDGDQCLLVFEHRCPNNSLPVLWKDSKDWKSLFPRD